MADGHATSHSMQAMPDTNTLALLRLHGWLMFLAWGLLVPFASILARYHRDPACRAIERCVIHHREKRTTGLQVNRTIEPDEATCRSCLLAKSQASSRCSGGCNPANWWLHCHRGIQVLAAWVLTFIAVSIAYSCVSKSHHDGKASHFHHLHSQVGLVVVVLAALMPVLGQVADCLYRQDRLTTPCFPDRLHGLLGWLLWTLSLVTIFLGIKHYSLSYDSTTFAGTWLPAYTAFASVLYVVVVGIIIVRLWRDRASDNEGGFVAMLAERGIMHPDLDKRTKRRGIVMGLLLSISVLIAFSYYWQPSSNDEEHHYMSATQNHRDNLD